MSREEAIKIIRKMLAYTDLTVRANLNADMVSACNLAIKALEQKPTDKKFTKADINAIVKAINKGWELRVNDVLDKIRAEIVEKYWDCDICKWKSGHYLIRGDISDILQIIDKYKAESEDT